MLEYRNEYMCSSPSAELPVKLEDNPESKAAQCRVLSMKVDGERM